MFVVNVELPGRWPGRSERYLLGHAGKDVHAGYGKQWIETLKAAIEVIPNPFLSATGQRRDCPEGTSEGASLAQAAE
jgi:hypothetical protein